MQLEVCFLYQTYPQLSSRWVCTKPVSHLISWQVIVYMYTSPHAIYEELNNVVASWIVDWLAIVVLWEDVRSNETFLMLVLQFVVAADGKCRKDGTICNLLLLDFVSIDSRGDVWHTIDEVLMWNHVFRPRPLLQFLHLTYREWKKSFWVFVVGVLENTIDYDILLVPLSFCTYLIMPVSGCHTSKWRYRTVELFSIIICSTWSCPAKNTFLASQVGSVLIFCYIASAIWRFWAIFVFISIFMGCASSWKSFVICIAFSAAIT